MKTMSTKFPNNMKIPQIFPVLLDICRFASKQDLNVQVNAFYNHPRS